MKTFKAKRPLHSITLQRGKHGRAGPAAARADARCRAHARVNPDPGRAARRTGVPAGPARHDPLHRRVAHRRRAGRRGRRRRIAVRRAVAAGGRRGAAAAPRPGTRSACARCSVCRGAARAGGTDHCVRGCACPGRVASMSTQGRQAGGAVVTAHRAPRLAAVAASPLAAPPAPHPPHARPLAPRIRAPSPACLAGRGVHKPLNQSGRGSGPPQRTPPARRARAATQSTRATSCARRRPRPPGSRTRWMWTRGGPRARAAAPTSSPCSSPSSAPRSCSSRSTGAAPGPRLRVELGVLEGGLRLELGYPQSTGATFAEYRRGVRPRRRRPRPRAPRAAGPPLRQHGHRRRGRRGPEGAACTRTRRRARPARRHRPVRLSRSVCLVPCARRRRGAAPAARYWRCYDACVRRQRGTGLAHGARARAGRVMLADRLLAKADYDCSREVRTLELLKLRFGDANLHNCEARRPPSPSAPAAHSGPMGLGWGSLHTPLGGRPRARARRRPRGPARRAEPPARPGGPSALHG